VLIAALMAAIGVNAMIWFCRSGVTKTHFPDG
jgi:hypothetical protein